MIEKVEELGAQLNALRLTNWKTFDDREVDVSLPWPAQNIAADVTEVSSGRAGRGCSVGTGNYLTRQYSRPHEREWIEKISGRDVAGGSTGRRAWCPACEHDAQRGAWCPVMSMMRSVALGVLSVSMMRDVALEAQS